MRQVRKSDISPVVLAIGQLNRQGDIIPHAWFQCEKFRYESGKPNLIAMHVLANILYWYTPTYIRSEATQEFTEIRQKFRSDKLQLVYKKMGEFFGFSKRQVQEAVTFLVQNGFLTRELRDTHTKTDSYYNQVFVEPVVAAIIAINQVQESVPSEEDFSEDSSEDEPKAAPTVSRSIVTGGTSESDTPEQTGGGIPRSVPTPTPERTPSPPAVCDISSDSSSGFSSAPGVAGPPPHVRQEEQTRKDQSGGASLFGQEEPSNTTQPPATIDPQRSLRSQAESKRAAGGVAARHGELGLPESVKQWYDANGQYIGPNYACPVL